MVKRYILSFIATIFFDRSDFLDSFMNLLGTKLLELCCISDEALHGGDENLVLLVV